MKVKQALERAVAFAEKQGTATYDPYDYKGSPLLMRLQESGTPGKLVLKTVYGAAFLAPSLTRNVLGVRKTASAGGLAHMASAYCELGHPEKAHPLLQELEKMAEGSSGWGLPFAWQSGVATVEANTPIGHTTMTVGNAFFDYHALIGDDWSLHQMVKACEFLSTGLAKTETDGGGTALSYTPLDNSKCVNSNADAAAFLAKVGAKVGLKTDIQMPRLCRGAPMELAQRIAHFVVSAQNEDGSWNYLAGVKQGSGSIIDHYHTAMTISAMWPLAFIFCNDACREAGEGGLVFYLDNLFLESGGPKFSTDRDWPVDIYGCAQGLLTLVEAAENSVLPNPLRTRAREAATRMAEFTIETMQEADGSFLYRRYRFGKMRLKSLRWAQALTIRALARYHRLGSSM